MLVVQTSIHVNRRVIAVEAPPDTPLLWVLRDHLGLTGTKFSCGAGLCGACTVLVGDRAERSCQLPLSAIGEDPVVTIEGLSADASHPLQRAWIAEAVSQCGYCQPGQIMAAAGLLRRTPRPTDDEINQALEGNLCRCGTYLRVRRAIHRAAGEP
jgi:aerobic-type carbon monoxide dehydrogenase small subunit (CoxS/CutS family)